MSELDLACGHCGHEGPIELAENVVLRREVDHDKNVGDIDLSHIVAVYRCRACDEPTIFRYIWADVFDTAFGDRRLYPTQRDNSPIPESVRKHLDAALRVKKIEPGFYAVGIRRMLEAVCNDQGAEGRDLFHKLNDLAAKERIPATLAQIGHQLRELGKFGAHAEDVDVSQEDVPVIEDLADAILEYLYRAPAKLTTVQVAMAERRGAAGPG